MKIIKLSVLAISLALSTTACSNHSNTTESHTEEMHKNHDHEGHEHHSEDMEHSDKSSAEVEITPTTIDEAMASSLMSDYLKMKQALTNNNGEEAKAAATAMMNALNGTDDELGKKLLLDAEHIATTTEVSHQRDHFEILSKNMYALGNQVATGKELYWQHCPMAFDGKGANWLSNEAEIRNPYFGAKMLKCGKVESKI